MKTLNLKEAAIFLKMTPEGLRVKVAKGEIPASKVGKYWIFIEADLVDYMRSRYSKSAETSWGVVDSNRRTTWHSTKGEVSGGLISDTKVSVYNDLLGLQTK